MALSTIQKIDRLSTDADLMHAVTHGGIADTVVTEGGVVPSMANAVNTLKAYTVRGAWVSGMTLTMKDVFTYGTVAYVALAPQPFVSTSVADDLAAGRVSVHQGATREELAAQDGGTKIGVQPENAGDPAITLQDYLTGKVAHVSKLAASGGAAGIGYLSPSPNAEATDLGSKAQEWRSVLDFMTPAEKADVWSGNPVLDHTLAYEKASAAGVPLLLPPVIMNIEQMSLRSQLSILSMGAVIRDVPSSLAAQVILDAGPVTEVKVLGRLRFQGNASNATKRCFFLDGRAAAGGSNGGLWWSDFIGLYISGYGGSPLYLRGAQPGDQALSADCPMQFLNFHNPVIYGGPAEDAVILEGKIGQAKFIGGQFEGYNQLTRPLMMKRRVQESGAQGDGAPYTISFDGATFQSGSNIQIERAQTTRFCGGHLENMASGFLFTTSWDYGAVEGVEFNNVYKGDGTGYCIQTGSSSFGSTGHLTVRDVTQNGSAEHGIVGSASADIQLLGNIGMKTESVASVQIAAAATGVVTMYGRSSAFVSATANIAQLVGTGLSKSITCNGSVTFASGTKGDGTDIYVPGGSKAFNPNATAYFVKNDLAGITQPWRLIN